MVKNEIFELVRITGGINKETMLFYQPLEKIVIDRPLNKKNFLIMIGYEIYKN